MAGFFGAVAKDNKDLGALFHSMNSAIFTKPDWRFISADAHGLALGGYDTDLTCSSRFNCEIDDRDDLLVAVKGDVWPYGISAPESSALTHGARTRCEFIRRAWLEYGDRMADRIQGKYFIILHDKISRRTQFITDRHALVPMFYADTPYFFMFAYELGALLNNEYVARKADEQAVAEFTAFEFCLEDRTFVRDIKTFGPGSVTAVTPEATTRRDYWAMNTRLRPDTADERPYVEECYRLTKQAVMRGIEPKQDRIVTFLSGGLDSRLIAGILKNEGVPFESWCLTGSKKSLDWRYSDACARALKIKHLAFPITPETYPQIAPELMRVCDYSTSYISYVYPGFRELRGLYDLLFLGYLGDSIYGSELLNAPLDHGGRDRMDSLANYIYRSESATNLGHLLGALKGTRLAESIRAIPKTVRSIIDPNRGRDDEAIIFNFKMRQRQPKYTIYFQASAGNFLEYRLPYCDYELVDFCMDLPRNLLVYQKIQRLMIGRYIPEVYDIGWQHFHYPPSASDSMYEKGKREAFRQNALKRLTALMTLGRWAYTPSHYEYPKDQWLRREPQASFVKSILLNERALARPWWSRRAAASIVSRHQLGLSNFERPIFALVGLELFLQRHSLDV